MAHALARDALGAVPVYAFAGQAHLAARVHQVAADGAQRGGLARAIGAQQGRDAAFGQVHVDAVQHAHRPVGRMQSADFKQCRHAPHLPVLILRLHVRTQVGADDFGMGADLARRALGDLAAEVQRHDLVAHAHDQAHVVLHQQHGQPQPVAQRQDQVAQASQLLMVEAAGRLVQQQQLRAAGQGARQLHALLRAEGQVGHAALCHARQLQQGHQRLRLGAGFFLAPAHAGQAQGVAHKAGVLVAVRAQAHVVGHRHAGKQGQVLEGTAHAQRGHAVARQRGQRLAAESGCGRPARHTAATGS